MNVLIILGILFAALILIVPLIEKTAKPVDDEQMNKYSKIMMGLILALILISSLKFCMG